MSRSAPASNNLATGVAAGEIWVRRLGDGRDHEAHCRRRREAFSGVVGDGKFVLYAGGVNSQTITEKQADGAAPPIQRAETDTRRRRDRRVTRSGMARVSTRHGCEQRASIRCAVAAILRQSRALQGRGKYTGAGDFAGREVARVRVTTRLAVGEVFVVPFPNVTAAKWQVSRAGGNDPHWSNRGDELVYRDNDRFLVSVPVTTKPTFSSGNAQASLLDSPVSPRVCDRARRSEISNGSEHGP
jgi:hypothetical protein